MTYLPEFLKKASIIICLPVCTCLIISNACAQAKPNLIFILADDVGYSVPTINGGQSYSTPRIDSMARHGINFTHCEATPLYSPSRFMSLQVNTTFAITVSRKMILLF